MVAVQFEVDNKDFKKHPEHSFTFFLLTFPLYSIVLFGCYTLISIGYHLIVLGKLLDLFLKVNLFTIEDCKEAQDELMDEIREAKKYLTGKGMKIEMAGF